MKFFVVAFTCFVVAKAGVIAPVAVATSPAILAIPAGQHSSQFHAQDAIGQYAYGYANELSAKNEIKSGDGSTVGSYSYIDGEGKIQNVQYRSDAIHGFRVSATNLPVGPSAAEALPQPESAHDTPEVIEARSKHLAAVEEVKKSTESGKVELKSAIHAQPIAAPAPASPAVFLRTAVPAFGIVEPAPVLAAPAFGYSYGVNYGGIYGVNSYAIPAHQPLIAAYASPAILSAPIAQPATVAAEAAQEAPTVPQDTPEVVEARARHLETVENIKKDLANHQ